uniref:Zinc finger MYM-type protein 1 n=2 Tax=Schizaphis graminum TaxID=13262 RepID=A0A2S2PBA1_SCHGA
MALKSWTKDGFSTWISGLSRIINHEVSTSHITSTIKVKTRTKCLPLLPSMEHKRKCQISMNRQIVSELIAIVIFLAQHNLGFRGHNEKWSNALSKGNFKDLVLLMSTHSATLSEHVTRLQSIGKKELSFISWERQNQIIDSIAQDIASQIQTNVKQSKIFSISIDSTFDTSRKEQVSFIIRYVCPNTGSIFERLLAIRESPNTCGIDLFSLFINVMKKYNIDWINDLVGQSYDGASNMRGMYNGLQALVKAKNKHATFVWCHAHRLNLVVKELVSSSVDSVNLFGNLETLYSFIWYAKKRVALYRQFQEKHNNNSEKHQLMALKRVCNTRWSSHSTSLDTVLKTYTPIIDTLKYIQKYEGMGDAKTGATASGLIDYLTSYRFLLTAFAFQKIFRILEPVNKLLQAKDLDLMAAVVLIENAKSKICMINCRDTDSFSDVVLAAEQFSETIDVEFVALPTPRCRRVPKFSGELQRDEPITDPITKFKVECYYGALDIIQNELNNRFGNDEAELLKDLSLLSKKRILEVKNSPNSLPKDAFKIVCELYSTFLQYDDLVNEYQQFCSNFLELEKSILLPEYLHNNESESDESDYEDGFDSIFEIVEQDKIENQPVFVTRNLENVGSMGKLFKLFCVSQLKCVFPNLHTLLHIAVTLPVSSCSVERSFSKLKLVKTKLRTTMKEERLESLLKITCEQDCVPNVENVINNFANKSSELSKALLY